MYRTIGSELPGYGMTDQIPNVGKLIGVIFSVRSTLRPLHLSQMSMDWIHHELGWVFFTFERVGTGRVEQKESINTPDLLTHEPSPNNYHRHVALP